MKQISPAFINSEKSEDLARKVYTLRKQQVKWKDIATQLGISMRHAMRVYYEFYSAEDRDLVRRLTSYHNELVKKLIYHLYDKGYTYVQVAKIIDVHERAVYVQFPKKEWKLRGGETK